MGRLARYAFAFAGPASGAGAQFLLTLILLHLLSAAGFGAFSLLLVASQFSWGIWSALFCAPLPVMFSRGNIQQGDVPLAAIAVSSINFLAAIPVALFFLALARILHFDWTAAALFALYVAGGLWRWFARAFAYARGRQGRAVASDLLYSAALLAATPVLQWGGGNALAIASAALAIGVLVGLLPFGADPWLPFRPTQSLGARWRSYCAVWREHSGWSLLGVLTTEATTNAHSYIVTLLLGPRAFAVVAASALLTRPATVVLNALNEYERAQMAREIAGGDRRGLQRSMRFFRTMLSLAWAATALAIMAVLWWAPHIVIPQSYDLRAIAIGSCLWMLVIAVRVLRAPESAMMQGGGAFRDLAMASVWSAGVSVLAVAVMVVMLGPIWSILGILAGELAFGFVLWPQARRWLSANMPGGVPA